MAAGGCLRPGPTAAGSAPRPLRRSGAWPGHAHPSSGRRASFRPGVSLALMAGGSFARKMGENRIRSLVVSLGDGFGERQSTWAFPKRKHSGENPPEPSAFGSMPSSEKPKGHRPNHPPLELRFSCWISALTDPPTSSANEGTPLTPVPPQPPAVPSPRMCSRHGTSWPKPTCPVAVVSPRSPSPPARLGLCGPQGDGMISPRNF